MPSILCSHKGILISWWNWSIRDSFVNKFDNVQDEEIELKPKFDLLSKKPLQTSELLSGQWYFRAERKGLGMDKSQRNE